MAHRPAPRRGAPSVPATDETSTSVLIFERYDLLFDTGIIRYVCSHIAGKTMNEYSNGIQFMSHGGRLPDAWRNGRHPEKLILAYGMAAISHIWTGFCTPTIIVRAGHLEDADVEFWQETFTRPLRALHGQSDLRPGPPLGHARHPLEVVAASRRPHRQHHRGRRRRRRRCRRWMLAARAKPPR